jgi:hypothetical protein
MEKEGSYRVHILSHMNPPKSSYPIALRHHSIYRSLQTNCFVGFWLPMSQGTFLLGERSATNAHALIPLRS